MRRFIYYGASSAGATLLLDLYPATVAYSLRKLRTAYTGAAIRVRRSSDNEEQDIEFVDNDLDAFSLLSFVGSGNGFVVTWYDQQGGNNLTQVTVANQPQIVASGVTILRGGKPAVKFDGSNDVLRFNASVLNINNTSYFSVNNNDLTGSVGGVHHQSNNTNNTISTLNDSRSVKLHLRVATPTAYNATLSTIREGSNQRLLSSFIDNSNNMIPFDNGVAGTNNTYIGTPINNGFRLGSMFSFALLNGTIQEFIGYNTNEIANRLIIETNINNYYAIY